MTCGYKNIFYKIALFSLLGFSGVQCAIAQTIPPAGSVFRIVSGDPQTLDANNNNSQPMIMELIDTAGNPVAGAQVERRQRNFSNGAIRGSAPAPATGTNGRVVIGLLTYPTSDGEYTTFCLTQAPGYTATGSVTCIDFVINGTLTAPSPGNKTLTVTADSSNSGITIVSGNNQNGFVNQALPQPFVVRMVSGGLGVPNAQVEWLSIDKLVVTTLGTTTTDANGQTQFTFTPPDAVAGRTVSAGFPGTGGGSGLGGNSSFSFTVQPTTLACTPTISPNPATAGQAFTLIGNCTINGVAATTGVETWAIPANGNQAAQTVSRTLPAASPAATINTAGTYTLGLSFAASGVTQTFSLPVTIGAPPTVACAPTFTPASPIAGQPFTIDGNCTVNGVAATTGTETWNIPAIGAQPSATVTRALPAAAVQRTINTAGSYNLSLQFTNTSGTSPTYTPTVVVQKNAKTALPTPAAVAAVAQTIQATANTSKASIKGQFSNIQTRFRYLRGGSSVGWINDTTISINGRAVPIGGVSDQTSNTEGSGDKNSNGSSSSSASSAPADNQDDITDIIQSKKLGGYVMGNIGVEELKGANGFKIGTTGITLGADYRFNRQVVIGGALGYSKSETDTSALSNAQRATGGNASIYGSFAPAPKWYIDTALSIMRNNFSLKRYTNEEDIAYANTKGSGTGLTFTTGYQFDKGGFLLSPYMRWEALNVNIDGFTENGNNPLIVGEQGLKSTVVTLGGEAQYIIPTTTAIYSPHVRFEMQRQTQNSVKSVTAQLVGSSVQVVVDPQLEVDKNFGFIGIGLSAQFRRGLSAFADYEQLLAKSNFSEKRFNVGLKLEF